VSVNRQKVAVEAAKILAEGFTNDYHLAKQKALKNMGISDVFELPSNVEVEAELKSIQGSNKEQEKLIHTMREQALFGLKTFDEYNPRLVGPVYAGTATKFSPIEIHVYCDSPKDVLLKLMDLNIPFDTEDRDVRLSKNESTRVSVYCFGAGDYEFEISVLPPNSLRQSPLSPISGQPMERASLKKLKKMLARDDDVSQEKSA